MITLEWIWALLLLPLPLVVRWLVPAAKPRRAGALKVPFYREMRRAGLLTEGARRRLWRLLAMTLIWVLLVIAAARPAFVGAPIALPVEGRDVMLAVDLSLSMSRQDLLDNGLPSDRLSVVKRVADNFIAGREGDRVGLILFSSRAYVQAPLTFDRNVVRELLRTATIGMTGAETAIGDAITLAVKALKSRPEEQRLLVLLTDGANTAGVIDPIQAADVARAEHVKIYTIGVGADALPSRLANPTADIDEATLTRIAQMTGGQYFRARDTEGLAAIYRAIDRMEPSAGEPQYFSPRVSLFYWPLGAALVLSFLFAAGFLLPARARRAPVPTPSAKGAHP